MQRACASLPLVTPGSRKIVSVIGWSSGDEIAQIVLAQRVHNARTITASLAALTFLAAASTFCVFAHSAVTLFLLAIGGLMMLAYGFARKGALGVAVPLVSASVLLEHIGAVVVIGSLGPMPYIAPVTILVAAAIGTTHGLWLALGACLVALGVEGAIANRTEADLASLVAATLFSLLIFVVALLHTRGVERAFALATDHAKGRDEAARLAVEAESRYRLIAENADDLISLVRRDGTVAYMSPSHERVLGLPVSVLTRGVLTQHLRVANLDVAGTAFEQAFIDGRGEFELMIYRSDGVLRILDVYMRKVHDQSDELMVLISRDVTERRRLERRVQVAERIDALGHLAAGIAHDFNNMLTVIRCSVEIVREHAHADQLAVRELDTALGAVTTAAELAQQLLAFGRRQAVALAPTCLNTVLNEHKDLLARLVGPKVSVRLQLGPDVPAVNVARLHVEQLAMNLSTNARDAMPDGGLLTLSTRVTRLSSHKVEGLDAGDYVEFETRDEGVGIAHDIQSRIFEPLFSTKGGLGTGLGLATCQAIAAQAGGAITVESEPGHGAAFRVYLPIQSNQG